MPASEGGRSLVTTSGVEARGADRGEVWGAEPLAGTAPNQGPARRRAEITEPLDEAADSAKAGRRIEAAGEAAPGELCEAPMEAEEMSVTIRESDKIRWMFEYLAL